MDAPSRPLAPSREAELAHGASGEGASVVSAGVVPTPAIAYLARTANFDAGVVISASHNPFEDNGIKVFSGRGEKFTEPIERQIEAIVADRTWSAREGPALTVEHADLVGEYHDHLRAVFPEGSRLGRFKLAIDCANGATTPVAPQLFAAFGFDTVTTLVDAPRFALTDVRRVGGDVRLEFEVGSDC